MGLYLGVEEGMDSETFYLGFYFVKGEGRGAVISFTTRSTDWKS